MKDPRAIAYPSSDPPSGRGKISAFHSIGSMPFPASILARKTFLSASNVQIAPKASKLLWADFNSQYSFQARAVFGSKPPHPEFQHGRILVV
jgi:hypothetical protein